MDGANARLRVVCRHVALKSVVTVAPCHASHGGILVANRGEIAVRICRAAAELGLRTVSLYSEDDARSLHASAADATHPLLGSGVAAYLDVERVVGAAKATGCNAVHPGYGFLSENAHFAQRCKEEGLTFIGPRVELLELFGDKGRARAAAVNAGVPVMRGSDGPVSLDEAKAFFSTLAAGAGMMIKAVAGGGGRGSRAVLAADHIEGAFQRASSEALNAFGNGDVIVEELMMSARHIEVQVIADTAGHVVDLGERECSVQRQFQKLIETAPAAHMENELRRRIIDAALKLARAVNYSNVGTFEFLVDSSCQRFAFMEANPRLQVEHTVSEEVTGVDICACQIRLALGAEISDLGFDFPVALRGFAIQARVNMETMSQDGKTRPSGGTLLAYDPPGGRGVRVDGCGYTGYETSTVFDSLLAKVVVHATSGGFPAAAARLARALSEFKIDGVNTNISMLRILLSHPDFLDGKVHTRFVDESAAELVCQPQLPNRFVGSLGITGDGFAGARVDAADPLALFAFGQDKMSGTAATVRVPARPQGPPGTTAVPSPMQGKLLDLLVTEGDAVLKGQRLATVEAMKMEHDVLADRSGFVRLVTMAPGDVVREGFPLVFLEEAAVQDVAGETRADLDLDQIRPDLALVLERKAMTTDARRPQAVQRRRNTGQRTARENLEDLCDWGSFAEYGGLVVARQRRRRSEQWLLENTPADGLVCGLGTVNAKVFGERRARVMALSYDYTVLAGTQGASNHYKQDRMFPLAARLRLPVCIFTEGGGGRPGDTEGLSVIGMDCTTFMEFSKLSGRVPLVGICSGFCFAGNTALLGCCDVIIATSKSTIAMGGPAMIEGGGLGVYKPEDVGPMSFQVPNGVVDILVDDDAAAVACAKKYLSYFQGATASWEASDQRRLRHIVPESRVRTYDMREVINTLCDIDSVLEIRAEFGVGIITALVRIEGVPMGLIANNPAHMAGAIDSPASDKGARFLQLCDAFELPILSLMDCPGMMVGPAVEQQALVRHCARLFNIGGNVTVPMFGFVLRKAYGLGVQAMCGGSSMFPSFTVAWPTGEFAGMNIEGAVKLGYRRDLEAQQDSAQRLAQYNRMVEQAYDRAKAVNSATHFGIDDVIDPAESRRWIVRGLTSLPPECMPGAWAERKDRKRAGIDTW